VLKYRHQLSFFVTQPACEGKFIGKSGRGARAPLNEPPFPTDGFRIFLIIGISSMPLTANSCGGCPRESILERIARQFTIKASSTAVPRMQLPLPFSLTK
jgi:hypothetical protein